MRAFVLGAGSNLGPMQAGGLRALFEQKIYPDILIGCSVGSLNASFIAQGFNEQNLQELAVLWEKISRKDIYPGSKAETLFRLLSGRKGLTNNRQYHQLSHQTTPHLWQTWRGSRYRRHHGKHSRSAASCTLAGQ